jgi:hypothetical protein
MRFRTDQFDTMKSLDDEYRSSTAGRSTYTSEVMGRDLDTGEYVVIVTFPSKEAADINNELPETSAMAEKMAAITTEGPSFSNIEVVDL